MKLLLRSNSNLLLSVRKVTQDNTGRETAGVDKKVALTAKARLNLVEELADTKLWKARPARRVYIPKAGGKQRPLGIPTIKNRCVQAIVKNALEPFCEARFEPNSYGFRPGRSCHDAIERCFHWLRGCSTHRWVLDADIKGAFDNLSHEFILKVLTHLPGRQLIKQWLKAGYVESGVFHATNTGVPQGSIIGPLLANVALDGMESLLNREYGFIRYADDFVITARSSNALEKLRPSLEKWLSERGLEMNDEKTRIISVEQGFDFLGFNIKHYQGKCLIRPEKAKVLALLRSIRQWLSRHRQVPAAALIRHLNPILNGWANYYRHAVSKATFRYVSHEVWRAVWQWCIRRHPKKRKDWIKRRYFTSLPHKRSWIFTASYRRKDDSVRNMHLTDVGRTPIRRHIKVRANASPDDASLRDYWAKRSMNTARRATSQSPRA